MKTIKYILVITLFCMLPSCQCLKDLNFGKRKCETITPKDITFRIEEVRYEDGKFSTVTVSVRGGRYGVMREIEFRAAKKARTFSAAEPPKLVIWNSHGDELASKSFHDRPRDSPR